MENQRVIRIPPDGYTEKELGTYPKIHRDMLFYCEREKYDEFYNSGKLLGYLRRVREWTDKMIDDINKEYASLGPATQLNIIEDYVGSWAGTYKLERYKKELMGEVRNALVHCLNAKVSNEDK